MTDLAFPIFNLLILGSFVGLASAELIRHRKREAPAYATARKR